MKWTPFAEVVPNSGKKLPPNRRLLVNNRYTVIMTQVESEKPEMPKLWHLSIHRNDRKPIRDWRDLQKIKNDIIGPECEGVEIFPAESRLVDTSNQYHLWVFEGRLPFGFGERYVVENPDEPGAVQRPFAPEHAPEPEEAVEIVHTMRGFTRETLCGAAPQAAVLAGARVIDCPDCLKVMEEQDDRY